MITFIKDIIAAINFSQDHVHASCIKKFRAPGDIMGDTDSVRISHTIRRLLSSLV